MSGHADISGVRVDLIMTMHLGDTSNTVHKQYINDNSLKERISVNIFGAGVRDNNAAVLDAR